MSHRKAISSVVIPLLLLVPHWAGALEFVDQRHPDPAKVELGRQLFFDKILSGNRNISCATCHHPLADTGDGLSLPIGEGGTGLGVTRNAGLGADAVHERVPRNAPPVFALGSTAVTRIFHDGRIEVNADFPSGFFTPAGFDLPPTLDNILAAQAMFPVTSADEMAGQPGENAIADLAATGDLRGIWRRLAGRLADVPGYARQFGNVYGIAPAEITFAHAANAIAAFEIDAWRADDTAYDRYLAGNSQALNKAQRRGMKLFFGKAGCSGCHSGELFSDMGFHAIAMPQIGPGKGDGPGGYEDWGRYRVTGRMEDKFRFRTPPLRNVALTAPYGHAGAYDTLEAVIRHHLDPLTSLDAYDCRSEPTLPERPDLSATDCLALEDPAARRAIAGANELQPISLDGQDVAELAAFLHALTDAGSLDLRRDAPMRVPSGLPLAE
ncbi:cytochrome-c peroxidase [Lentisalinibacter sediminis]|uniref:cytochrome-c peroxidase n=1 Tax=Lentisalinibacter sediminis TaxID=2992237 RepID=UPI00386A4314